MTQISPLTLEVSEIENFGQLRNEGIIHNLEGALFFLVLVKMAGKKRFFKSTAGLKP